MMSPRLRVVDLTDDLALNAGRLLVGLGADVIRIELRDDPRPPAASRLHWHAGKRVVRVADDAERLALLARLLPGADVVLESGPARRLRTLSLRESAPESWRHVVHVVVTPFGLSGPCRDWLADDLVATAAGGMVWLGGDPGDPPIPPPRQQATQLAGTHAAIAAMLALVERGRSGRGQLAEVSVQEAVAATLETGAIAWIHGGTVPGRTSGVYGHVAHRVFAARDGYVAGGYSGSNRMWDDLLAWMVEEGEAADLQDERWQDPVLRWEGRPHVDAVVAAFVARRTVEEIATEARRRALPWAAVAAPGNLLANPQLRDRGFLTEIVTEHGGVTDVGFPFESPALRRPVRLPAPSYVGAGVAWAGDDSERGDRAPSPHRTGRTTPVRGAALDGLRVLDLTWVLAGPYVTKILGEHGADIVKVESRHRQDPTRFAPSMRLRPGASYDESGYFLNFNRNKRSLSLNLRTERGQELLRDLVSEVDVVVENFSPGVLARWGLGFDQMRELNPGVVLVSMAGVGQTGPWRTAVTFADTLAAMSGLTHETGGDGRAPQGLTFGLGDIVAANAATLAVLDLVHAGRGGHVDLSQLEAMASHLGPALLEAQAGAATPPASPPAVLRTRGDDRWIAVAATPDDRLSAALAELTGAPLDDAASLVADQDADELAAALQAWGIAAYPVRDGRDLVELDGQLAARGFYTDLDHPLVGKVPHEGVVAHLGETPGGLWAPAPLLGQHTDELLGELLGLTPDELTALRDEGVLE